MSAQVAPPDQAAHGAPDTSARRAASLLRATRPRQWLKNVLVVAAPASAGVLLHGRVLLASLVAIVSFVLVASSCYLINDVADQELDRAHPAKRLRPIASGAVGARLALTSAALLLGSGLLVAAAQSRGLLVLVGCYAAVTVVYALGLKGVAWLELSVVASGFVLRALAGGSAASVPISRWFLLVVTASASLIVVSKRMSELIEVPLDPGSVRPVLRRYSLPALRRARTAAVTVLLVAYGGWAVTRPTTLAVVCAVVSLVPLLAVVRLWVQRSDQGRAGAPEDLVSGDRTIRVLVLAWAVLFAATVLSIGRAG